MTDPSTIPILDAVAWRAALDRRRQEAGLLGYAMYSTLFDGIVTDPLLMMLPIDDHLTHRGDGAFESCKCVDGSIFNLGSHLDRLQASCERIQLTMPFDRAQLERIIVDAVRAGDRRDCMLRILISRGIGAMGIDPYDCLRPECHILVYPLLKPHYERYHAQGVSVAVSAIPMKPPFFATIKSCNYLPNVLMKKEAHDRGVDYTVSIDETGALGEGPTENIAMVSAQGRLLTPSTERVLTGTTVQRVLALADELIREGLLISANYGRITLEDMADAREAFMVGTTQDVSPIVLFENQSVGDGRPGPVYARLLRSLHEEIAGNSIILTPVFD